MIDGKVDGRRGRGRPKARWIDDVRKMTGQSIDQLNVAAVLDRGGAGSWRCWIGRVGEESLQIPRNHAIRRE